MASDSASVSINAQPAMTLVKSALGYHDLNNNDVADAGDVIDFSFMVNNTGNTALHNIGVVDLDGAVAVTGSTITSLAAGNVQFDKLARQLRDQGARRRQRILRQYRGGGFGRDQRLRRHRAHGFVGIV